MVSIRRPLGGDPHVCCPSVASALLSAHPEVAGSTRVSAVIYIDADQVVNADIGELWDMSLGRAAVGMTPFCQRDANQETTGFRFFAQGYWRDHLRGRPCARDRDLHP